MNGEVFTGGATTSQHVEAEDDDHFENTTFKLKRTRSMGLLDEFIQPLGEANSQDTSVGSNTDGDSAQEGAPADAHTHDTNRDEVPGESEKSPNYEEQHLSPGEPVESSSSSDESAAAPPVEQQPLELMPHDDTNIVDEPSLHVDYLSHQWDVSDILRSWRYIISKRKDVANSARLENASWRTWAQRRGNLKTISPEVVNWSKDSDVTWLYGPILKDQENEDADHDAAPRLHIATSAVAGDISINNKAKCKDGPKPILKHRTIEDLIISHSNLLKLELTTNKLYQKHRQKVLAQQKREKEARSAASAPKTPEFYDYDAISAKLNSQYKNIADTPSASLQSNSLVNLQNLVRKTSSNNLSASGSSTELNISPDAARTRQAAVFSMEDDTPSLPVMDPSAGPLAVTPVTSPPPAVTAKKDRHVHFNDVVLQCIAVDKNANSDDDDYSDDDSDYGSTPFNYNNPNGYNYYANGAQSLYVDTELANYDEDEDEDEDDEGGFFLKVKSPSTPSNAAIPQLASRSVDSMESAISTDSVSRDSHFKSIELLPSTSINFGSEDESSDDENPYTSSLSHGRGNSSRGYDYYYDYNTVYTCDPNHAVFGKKDAPDVCDVPENITLGSNIDHDVCEDNNMPLIYDDRTSAGVIAPTTPGAQAAAPLHTSDSEESDSDDEGVLSIGTSRSLQALAQRAFGVTAPVVGRPEPESRPLDETNRHYSSTSLAKQPSSSNSLSGTFFGTGMGMTGNDEEAAEPGLSRLALSRLFLGPGAMSKPRLSLGSLAELFFGGANGLTQPSEGASEDVNDANTQRSALSGLFFGERTEGRSPDAEIGAPLQRTLLNTQPKSSVLPPHTTSTNAFKGEQPRASRPARGFVFDDSGSEDSEDDERPVPTRNLTPSYASLSEVAGKSGITSPEHGLPLHNFVGQAKGLANLILGSWKSSPSNEGDE